jgi:hypothetical protein
MLSCFSSSLFSRVNGLQVKIKCRDLCGILHGAMPIVIQSVSLEQYFLWLSSQIPPF